MANKTSTNSLSATLSTMIALCIQDGHCATALCFTATGAIFENRDSILSHEALGISVGGSEISAFGYTCRFGCGLVTSSLTSTFKKGFTGRIERKIVAFESPRRRLSVARAAVSLHGFVTDGRRYQISDSTGAQLQLVGVSREPPAALRGSGRLNR